MGMRGEDERYANGQAVSEQVDDTLTYFFEDGRIKAQGLSVEGVMRGRWIFNKKEGYLWQVGHFDDDAQKHGSWIRYNRDGSVQSEQHFAHGKRTKDAN